MLLLLVIACTKQETGIGNGNSSGDDSAAASAVLAEIDPAEIAFTDVQVGYSVSQDLTVRSVGTEELTVYQIDLVADDTHSFTFTQVQSVAIPAGSQQAWAVSCLLAEATEATAALRVRTSDPGAAEVRVNLTCTPAAT